jgi:hypothetical protein
MNCDNRIAAVVLTGKKGLGFELIDDCAKIVDLPLELLIDAFAFAREFEIRFNVLGAAREVVLGGKRRLNALALAHHLLRLFLIGPEIGIGSLLFYIGELVAKSGSVKDTPAGRWL